MIARPSPRKENFAPQEKTHMSHADIKSTLRAITVRRPAVFVAVAVAFLLGAGPAAAAPIWNLDLHHAPTHFAPGGQGQYWLDLENLGDSASSGPITLTVSLPNGITRKSAVANNFNSLSAIGWSCPGSPGDHSYTCATTKSIPRHSPEQGFPLFSVAIAAGACGAEPTCTKTVRATVSGGGAPQAPPAAACNPGLAACTAESTPIDPEPTAFGIFAPSFTPGFFAADGLTPVLRAGAHPDYLTVPFDLSMVDAATPGTTIDAGSLRDVHVDTPPGFTGNPTVVSECQQAAFTASQCSHSAQVGTLRIHASGVGSFTVPQNYRFPVYNLSHPRGVISDLGLAVIGNPVHIKVHLDPSNRYAIVSEVTNINESLPPYDQKLTLWGVPADPSHDSERCGKTTFTSLETSEDCPTDLPRRPFLSLPNQCESPNTWRLHHYDSWQQTGLFGPEIDYTPSDPATQEPQLLGGCNLPRFEPDVEIEPTGKQANTPTGLDVHVKIAQNENPNALATPPVKRFTVRLPLGMSFSSSFADGLKSCTLAQMQLGNNEPVQCPDASRIGEVRLRTPLLPSPAEGSMYLAAQGDNPFGSTFALLLVLHDTEERGALIKIPGRIEVDETTGQIVTVFNDTPQFPFEDLTLKFRSGPRAPLVSPPTCGTQTIGVEVASYAQPQKPVDASNTYQVTEGPNGTPCPPDPAQRSFHPTFSGGTLNPVAGSYSPFLFRMTRTDDEQELSQVTSILPPGLVAKLAGLSLCPEQAIASISTELGTGAGEAAHPACPASSQIGSISAGLGAGPGPNYFPGKVYLAGPYKGAQLSLAIVAPGLAGPFDLGNVVVRAALRVNTETAQVTAVSDPFPTILHGVLLRVRDIRLRVDRPQTTINPTNCSQMSVDGQITGVGGSIFTPADDSLFAASAPFQVGSCSALSFKPKLDLRLFGGTHRGSHPKFRATLTMPPGGANIKSASVALPHSEFLDQGHIGTVCTRVQFAQGACPAASIYGTVTAKTPLLDETLTGNLYLRSSSNPLPDLVAAFRGGRIDADVVGRVDSVNGGIRNTFDVVPDVPVSTATFNFFGGRKGLLVNSRDVCKGTPRAKAVFNAQNGDSLTFHPALKSACPKAKKKAKRHNGQR